MSENLSDPRLELKYLKRRLLEFNLQLSTFHIILSRDFNLKLSQRQLVHD